MVTAPLIIILLTWLGTFVFGMIVGLNLAGKPSTSDWENGVFWGYEASRVNGTTTANATEVAYRLQAEADGMVKSENIRLSKYRSRIRR